MNLIKLIKIKKDEYLTDKERQRMFKEMGNPDNFRNKHSVPTLENSTLLSCGCCRIYPDELEPEGPSFIMSEIGNVRIWIEDTCVIEPHFHIFSEDGSFDTCLCVDRPEYFMNHGYTPDKMTEEQINDLMNHLLNFEHNFLPVNGKFYYCMINNYEKIRDVWVYSYAKKFSVPSSLFCPDYTKLK